MPRKRKETIKVMQLDLVQHGDNLPGATRWGVSAIHHGAKLSVYVPVDARAKKLRTGWMVQLEHIDDYTWWDVVHAWLPMEMDPYSVDLWNISNFQGPEDA